MTTKAQQKQKQKFAGEDLVCPACGNNAFYLMRLPTGDPADSNGYITEWSSCIDCNAWTIVQHLRNTTRKVWERKERKNKK